MMYLKKRKGKENKERVKGQPISCLPAKNSKMPINKVRPWIKETMMNYLRRGASKKEAVQVTLLHDRYATIIIAAN